MAARQTGPRLFRRPTNGLRVHGQCTCKRHSGERHRYNERLYRHCGQGCQQTCRCRCPCHQNHHHHGRPCVVIVKKMLTPVRVKAHNLDIRSLNAVQDSVEVYGQHDSNKLPVRVDDKGRLEVVTKGSIPSVVFSEETYPGIIITNNPTAVPLQDTSNKTVYTYSVVNRGSASIDVDIEVSPDGDHFTVDTHQQVASNETIVLVPKYFLKYTRLNLRTPSPSTITTADVYFQAQTLS